MLHSSQPYHKTILFRSLHASQVFLIANSLKISRDKDQIDRVSHSLKNATHTVERIQFTVSTSSNCDIYKRHSNKQNKIHTK